MKKILDFNDYLFDLIFENTKLETFVVLSERLLDLLKDIDHQISNRLIEISINGIKSDKVAYIDYDENNKGNFTYIIPSKIIDVIKNNSKSLNINISDIISHIPHSNLDYMSILSSERYFDDVWSKFRMSTSVNKVINKLFSGEFKSSGDPGKDLESFKNMIIAKREEYENIFERFKIVKGKDINKYYDENNYDLSGDYGSLGKSCMRYSRINQTIDFYSDNGVEMVVLFSKNDPSKIIGRALLWTLSEIDEKIVKDRKFMDRIYVVKDIYVNIFKSFAKKNGWLYKKFQSMNNNELIVDTLNNIEKYFILKVYNIMEKNYYPYLDTLKYYYHHQKFLTNSKKYGWDYLYLESTEGGPINTINYNEQDFYLEYYDEYFNINDLIFCDFGDSWRLPVDAVWLHIYQTYGTGEFINDEMYWSNYHNDYILKDESVYSKYLETYIISEKAGEIYIEGASNYDYEKIKNNNNFIDYIPVDLLWEFIGYDLKGKEEFFNPNDKENFINCYNINDATTVLAHKKWDKDKIIKKDDKYYYNDKK